ncbi:ca0b2f15-9b0a-4fe4-8403-b4b4f5e8bf2e [Sclerotinia trifoliorum]|uniref:Ca0b2f15-9b0a-4fe4-8403-b4b4f5e8bf2e n=1 Tax=Sclerotinia trifoliorum TaxID=28548 RepID=A0A8H2ZT05_9HELO|nr:ca0b2f15-9b0a-4fe4-8403-b4b4f5e8bf2e [Sclerotinia trifoliorum]
MPVLDPAAEASPPVEDEIRQLSEFEDYYKGINQFRESLNGILSAGNKLLSQVKVSRGNIEVILGTEADQHNIDSAWEEYMKTQINGSIIQDTDTSVEQRKKILKSIETIRRFDWDTEGHAKANHDVTSTCDTESASLTSDKISSFELVEIKEELQRLQNENDSLSLENRSIRNQLNNVEKERDALLYFRSNIIGYTQSLESKLKYLSCTRDFSALVMATSLRFLNLSTRRNDFGSFTTIPDRGPTNVDAIDGGSAALHSGNVRIHAFLIQTDSSDQFQKYSGLFKIIYGVTALEVAQGAGDKYSFDSKNTEIANFRGSMAHCLSFSKLTHDRIKDLGFEVLRERCETVYQRYLKELGSAAKAQMEFDND